MPTIKHIISCILLISFLQNSHCQIRAPYEKRILIYSNKNDFLIPYVETVLTELYSYSENKNYFSKVTNLNLLLLNTSADKAFRESLSLYFPNANFANTQVDESALKILTNNDLLLLVNENILQDKIEFQLTLYNIIKEDLPDKSLNEFPLRNIIGPLNSKIDFFIDVTSANYLSILKNELKRLFPDANFSTKYNPVLTGNIESVGNDSFNAAKDDTLLLNISDVYDEDTPIDQIKFSIQIKDLESKNDSVFFYLDGKGRNFNLVFKKSGNFRIMIFCDDGSNEVNLRIIKVKVKDAAKLFAVKNHFSVVKPLSFFQSISNNNVIIKVPVVVLNTDPNRDVEFHLLDEKKEDESEKIIVDSIFRSSMMHISKNRGMGYYPQAILSDSIYITKVEKRNDNLYIVNVSVKTPSARHSFKLYAISKNLHTNFQLIDFKITTKGLLYAEGGTKVGFLKIGNTTCACGGDSTEKISYLQVPLEVRFIPFSYKGLSFGISMGAGLTLSKNIVPGKYIIVRNFGTTVDMGIFAAASFPINYWDANIRIGYFEKHTFNMYDSAHFRNLILSNLGYGGISVAASLFPFKYPDFGISFGYGFVNQRFKYLRFKEHNFNIGLVFRY